MEKKILNLTQEQLQVLEDLSSVNFSLYSISLYMEIPLHILEAWMADESSPAFLAYQKGQLQTQFEIDFKLLSDSKTGNITAIQILDKHKKYTKLEETKRRIFYGEES